MRFSPAEADFSQTTAVLSEAPLTGAEFTAGPPEPGARNRILSEPGSAGARSRQGSATGFRRPGWP